VPVQDFYLGLDFSAIATRARLALGSYLAVQVPEARARVRLRTSPVPYARCERVGCWW
jgi:hypothetical protein